MKDAMKFNSVKGIPFDLQFFSEPEPPAEPQPTPEPPGEPQLTLEEQVQQLMVENAKLKKAQERAASEAADYKKKYNATLTDAQKAAQEKAEKEAEREERYNQLLRENEVNKLAKNFMKLGYPEERAEKAANAQYDNDTDTLFQIQSEVQADLLKQKEVEWLKSRPEVNTGAGDGEPEDAFLKGFNSVNNSFYTKK